MNDSNTVTIQFQLPRDTAIRLGEKAASAGKSLADHIIAILGSAALRESAPVAMATCNTATAAPSLPRKRKLLQWGGGGILSDLSRREIYDDAH